MSKRTKSLFSFALLRIIAAIFIFEIVVGMMAYFFLMLPVLHNHAKSFATQISHSSSQNIAGTELLDSLPVDGGPSWLPFNLMLGTEIQLHTGMPVEIRKVAERPYHYWFAFRTQSSQALVFDHNAIVGTMPTIAFVSWFVLALLAGLAIATWLAKGLSAPITNLRNSVLQHAGTSRLDPAPVTTITELDELQGEFVLLTEKLALALTDRTTLLLGLSHELSAPVARLTMAIELYAKKIDPEKQAGMQHDLEEMRRIIGQFLTAARGLNSADQEQEPLLLLLQRVAQRYADHPDIRFTFCVLDDNIFLNSMALERILFNLLENALKHSGDTQIEISLSMPAGFIEISVSDNGLGIPEAEIPRLFQPFEKRGPGQGVGLGLALCRLLAEQNGWMLTLSNRTTGGLRACIRIPCTYPASSMSKNK